MSTHHSKSAGLLALMGAAALLASCGAADPEPSPSPAPSDSATPDPTSAPPSAEPSTPGAEEVDTSDWEAFSAHGVGFKIPPGWSVEPDDCSYCEGDAEENPYHPWVAVSGDGVPTVWFVPDSATSPDGDMGSYERLRLEAASVPAELDKPATLVAEWTTDTDPDGGQRTFFASSIVMDENLADRETDSPLLSYFLSAPEMSTMMNTTPDLVEELGFERDEVTEEQAREILASEEYATARAIMLSVDAE